MFRPVAEQSDRDDSKSPETAEDAEAAERRKARRAARKAAREALAAAEAAEAKPSRGDEESEESDEEEEESPGDESAEDGAGETDESAEASEEEAAAEARPNRRERRRKKKLGDGEAEPRDRNARLRAQHARKQRAASEEALTPLSTGEMIDDALARGVARAGKWAKVNAGLLQGLVLVLVLGGIGYGVYSWQVGGKSEAASGLLSEAVQADRGRIDPAGPAPAKNGQEELVPVFRTAAERDAAALDGYRKARAARDGSGTAILARLGEAGVLLDKRSFDEALAAYREVKASPLAAADPDVRGRAIEGIGFALEGKGDPEGAIKVYKELDTLTGIKGFKELGMYHQARLLGAKGDKDSALKLLKDARERLQTSGESRSATYLVGVIEELQRKLDPSSAPKRGVGGAGKQMSVEELQKLQQQMMREMQKAQDKKGDEHGDEH